jgi:multiple sugar transport system substrate-binding protein
MKKRAYLGLLIGIVVAVLVANPLTARGLDMSFHQPGPQKQASAPAELTILWGEWAPAGALQMLADQYTQETGVEVNVIQDPWDTFPATFFAEMEKQGTTYDMVVGESMWLGKGASAGYYLDLTDFLIGENIAGSVFPATLDSFAEYPAGSDRFWAYPLSGNLLGYAYRRDLFEDPEKMASFEREYGYPLGEPEDFEQLQDMIEFFTKPDDGFMGVGLFTAMDNLSLTPGIITEGWQSVFFGFGANWHDTDNNVIGVANTPEAAAAAQYYQDIYRCCTAFGLANADYETVLNTFRKGLIVMGMLNFGFSSLYSDPATNSYADVTGFFVNPRGSDGERYAVFGGHAISVIAFTDPERQAASMDFLRWLAQDSIQAEWAALSGTTCNTSVLESEAFLSASPINAAYAEALNQIKDFWNVPVYDELLAISQKQLHNFVIERTDPAQKIVDNIAELQTQILQKAAEGSQ